MPASARASARRSVVARSPRASAREPTTLYRRHEGRRVRRRDRSGKFLRGLVRVVHPGTSRSIVNTADDIVDVRPHVSPDLDSVTYWLGRRVDRERGWGRQGETFRATEELRRFGAERAWFGLGDLDLATHLFRTCCSPRARRSPRRPARIGARFGVAARILPMSDDPVDDAHRRVLGRRELDLHFQEYWVRRRAEDDVKAVRFHGAETSRPAPGCSRRSPRPTRSCSARRTLSSRSGRSSPSRGSATPSPRGARVVGVTHRRRCAARGDGRQAHPGLGLEVSAPAPRDATRACSEAG